MRKKITLVLGIIIAIVILTAAICLLIKQNKSSDKWSTYKHPAQGFLIDVPPGSEVVPSGSENMTITFKPAGAPVPAMNIVVEDKIVDEYLDFTKIADIGNVEINGLKGTKRIEVYEADEMGPGSRCITYKLDHGSKTYSLLTWECLEWEPFERVVQSFRFP